MCTIIVLYYSERKLGATEATTAKKKWRNIASKRKATRKRNKRIRYTLVLGLLFSTTAQCLHSDFFHCFHSCSSLTRSLVVVAAGFLLLFVVFYLFSQPCSFTSLFASLMTFDINAFCRRHTVDDSEMLSVGPSTQKYIRIFRTTNFLAMHEFVCCNYHSSGGRRRHSEL